jgi:hypothetical protein
MPLSWIDKLEVPLDVEAFEWLAQAVDNVLLLGNNMVNSPSEAA